jgi:hypothetical protein
MYPSNHGLGIDLGPCNFVISQLVVFSHCFFIDAIIFAKIGLVTKPNALI